MTAAKYIGLCFIACALVYIISTPKELTTASYITKPLMMPLLAVFYVLSTRQPLWLVVAALLAGFLGDVFLLWSHRSVMFLAGLLVFLAGHIFYTIAFLRPPALIRSIPWTFYLTAIPFAVIGIVVYRALSAHLADLKPAVVLYIVVILAMCFASVLRLSRMGKSVAPWLTVAGALLFACSDTIIAFNQFKMKIPYGPLWINITYVGAQVLIVAGFLVKR